LEELFEDRLEEEFELEFEEPFELEFDELFEFELEEELELLFELELPTKCSCGLASTPTCSIGGIGAAPAAPAIMEPATASVVIVIDFFMAVLLVEFQPRAHCAAERERRS
jgi:hypothetical protein